MDNVIILPAYTIHPPTCLDYLMLEWPQTDLLKFFFLHLQRVVYTWYGSVNKSFLLYFPSKHHILCRPRCKLKTEKNQQERDYMIRYIYHNSRRSQQSNKVSQPCLEVPRSSVLKCQKGHVVEML